MRNYCQVWLTCADEKEAQKLIAKLLQVRLIACAKKLPVKSEFFWDGKVDHNNEVLIVMESREDLFEEIERQVVKIHSYETFVLQAIQMTKISKKAEKWLSKSLQ